MADERHKQEEILRYRVRRYLKEQKWGIELRHALERFEASGCSAFIVGGFLRDLMLDGPGANPRDIDIVFSGASPDKVEYLFWNDKERKNRFGGMRLKLRDCPFDVWSLRDTWAFRKGLFNRVEFSTFPSTTFLNLDAIAFKWGGRKSDDEIYSKGFFEGFMTRTLEINLEDNPFPETCIVRALTMASRLNFALGPKLGNYIKRYSKKASFKALLQIQKAHYGRVELDGEDLQRCLHAINRQLRESKDAVIFLPEKQLKLEKASEGNATKPSRSAVKTWMTKVSEAAFVHTQPMRRWQQKLTRGDRPAMNLLNAPPQWFSKAR